MLPECSTAWKSATSTMSSDNIRAVLDEAVVSALGKAISSSSHGAPDPVTAFPARDHRPATGGLVPRSPSKDDGWADPVGLVGRVRSAGTGDQESIERLGRTMSRR